MLEGVQNNETSYLVDLIRNRIYMLDITMLAYDWQSAAAYCQNFGQYYPVVGQGKLVSWNSCVPQAHSAAANSGLAVWLTDALAAARSSCRTCARARPCCAQV
jgi:hypothetical protein